MTKNQDSKTYHPVKTLRVPQAILKKIDSANFSEWVLVAIKGRLESEKGLTPAYEKKLGLLLGELMAMGRNLNQLTRAANSGKPVSISDKMVTDLMDEIHKIRQEIVKVKQKL